MQKIYTTIGLPTATRACCLRQEEAIYGRHCCAEPGANQPHMRDISTYKTQFEKWGRKMIFLFEDADNLSRFNFKEFDNLPSNVVWGTDIDKKIVSEIREQLKLISPSLPIFIICDSSIVLYTYNKVILLI